MSAHDSYLDPDRHLWPAEPPEEYMDGQAVVFDFFAAENEDDVQRTLYKSTDCGAAIEFFDWGIRLSSIVEGCAFGTASYPLNYKDKFTGEDIQARIDAIEAEASALWDWANVLRDCTGRRNINGKTDAERGADAPDISNEYLHLNPDGRSS